MHGGMSGIYTEWGTHGVRYTKRGTHGVGSEVHTKWGMKYVLTERDTYNERNTHSEWKMGCIWRKRYGEKSGISAAGPALRFLRSKKRKQLKIY